MTKRPNRYLYQEGGFYPQTAQTRCESLIDSIHLSASVRLPADLMALALPLNPFERPPVRRA